MTALVAAVVDGQLLVRWTPAGPVLPEADAAPEGSSSDRLPAARGARTTRALAPTLLLADEQALTLDRRGR